MYPNYNYMTQNVQGNNRQMAAPQQLLKGRPVSSIDEVRAIPIDFDGSVFFFPDFANKRIYTKQINMDGTASLFMYEMKEIPTEQMPSSDFITRDEFNKALTQLQLAIENKKEDEQTNNQFQF